MEYRAPLEEGEEDDSDSDPYAEELSTTTQPTTTTTPKRPWQTATVVLLEEMEKQQREETCYILELMQQWRCQYTMCKQYPDNACLVLPHEKQCRPLNSHVLGIWDHKIKQGQSTVHSFPLEVKMPPLIGEKSSKPSTAATTAPSSIQISVTAPPPMPWWMQPPQLPPPILVPHTSYALPGSQLSHPPHSSPIWAFGLTSKALLNSFIEWFKGTLTLGNEDQMQAVLSAQKELIKEMYYLEGVRTMDLVGWKELKVLGGMGKRISKAVQEFNNMRKNQS